MFERWPYTNFHDLNLDWIINKVKNIDDNVTSAQSSADSAAASAEAAAGSAEASAGSAAEAGEYASSIPPMQDTVASIENQLSALIVNGQQTEGNTELINIRTGADGVNYPTAGDAVRGQYDALLNIDKTLASDLYPFDGIPYVALTVGQNLGNNGAPSANAARTRSGRAPRSGKCMLTFNNASYQFVVYGYSSNTAPWNDAYISNTGWKNSGSYIVPETYPYIAMAFRRVDSAEMTADDSAAIMEALTFYRSSEKLPRTGEQEHFIVNVNAGADSVNAVLALPETYQQNGSPVKLLMLGHGRSDYVSGSTWSGDDADMLALVKLFTDAGYAVFDVNNSAGSSSGYTDCGCPKLMQSYIKALEYVQKYYNVEERIYVYGYSFGSFSAFNMITWYPGLVKACVISGARTDIALVYSRGGTYAQQLDAVYGFTDGYDASKTAGYDPAQSIHTVNGSDLLMKQTMPVMFMTSDGDTQDLSRSRECIEDLARYNSPVTDIRVSGYDHHAMCFLTDSSLSDAVIDYLINY